MPDVPAGTAPIDLATLCDRLRGQAEVVDAVGAWPSDPLRWLGQAGVYRWFVPAEYGGSDADPETIVDGYLKLAQSCLTTTFVLTQWAASTKRIVGGWNRQAQSSWLPQLASGSLFTTVAISHLTTSRRHLREPVLRAEPTETGFRLTGTAPWASGAAFADLLLTGATLPDGQEILVCLPTPFGPARLGDGLEGIRPGPAQPLLALAACQTTAVTFAQVDVGLQHLIAGPAANVLSTIASKQPWGFDTSALALGHAAAALAWLEAEAVHRPDLQPATRQLADEHAAAVADLFALARGDDRPGQPPLRARANSLALRATQAALVAAKGAGFVQGHPVARWCREALFFLVWSCPQPIQHANLCELAGLQGDD